MKIPANRSSTLNCRAVSQPSHPKTAESASHANIEDASGFQTSPVPSGTFQIENAMEWTPLPAAPEGAIMAERNVPWEKGASTMESTGMIGVGPGKRSFQLHGIREDGSAAFRMKVSRDRFLEEMSKRGPCKVAMEACGGARHRAGSCGRWGSRSASSRRLM